MICLEREQNEVFSFLEFEKSKFSKLLESVASDILIYFTNLYSVTASLHIDCFMFKYKRKLDILKMRLLFIFFTDQTGSLSFL